MSLGAPSLFLTSKSTILQPREYTLPESMAVTSASQPLLPARVVMGVNVLMFILARLCFQNLPWRDRSKNGLHAIPGMSLVCPSVFCLDINLANNVLLCNKITQMGPKLNNWPALAPGGALPMQRTVFALGKMTTGKAEAMILRPIRKQRWSSRGKHPHSLEPGIYLQLCLCT